jgi:uncharacterized protein YegP (UPF0339 family)
MKIEFYKSGIIRKSWKWRMVDENKIIAYGRGFNKKQNAQRSIEAIRDILTKNSPEIDVYYSGIIRKSWKWRLKSSNGRILASDKGFFTEEDCIKSLHKFKKYFLYEDTIHVFKVIWNIIIDNGLNDT